MIDLVSQPALVEALSKYKLATLLPIKYSTRGGVLRSTPFVRTLCR